jgi:hypothetical protein
MFHCFMDCCKLFLNPIFDCHIKEWYLLHICELVQFLEFWHALLFTCYYVILHLLFVISICFMPQMLLFLKQCRNFLF